MHTPKNWRQWTLILLGVAGALLVLPLTLIFA